MTLFKAYLIQQDYYSEVLQGRGELTQLQIQGHMEIYSQKQGEVSG